MPKPEDLIAIERPDDIGVVRALVDRARRENIEYFPSPFDWRDQILYFLLPDRFSDETTRPTLTRAAIRLLRTAVSSSSNWQQWAASGSTWQGGTLRGIQTRLPYLQRLRVSTLWIGPVFKQRARGDSFHGYGVQDFLEVDPRYGTRTDLIALVSAAHALGIRVILDVIINHSGDNWGYVPPHAPVSSALNEPSFLPFPDFYGNPNNPATRDWSLAWRDELQAGFTTDGLSLTRPHDGVWPRQLQAPASYTRAGKGDLGESNIGNPRAEHKRTDFLALKDFALDVGGTLSFLIDCFRYWIAISDCDGFRIDTVKHVSLEEARNFCGAIREFADTLGKRNFLLVGEIAGGSFFQDFVLDNLGLLERNLDAALDIGSARTELTSIGKGLAPASLYLEGFKAQSEGFESHRAFGDRHVSILDDHDHVIGEKLRFSAGIPDSSAVKDYQVVAATAFQLFTLGIPCIYYGTEQALAGPPQSQLGFLLGEGWGKNDRFLREAMFGPEHPRAHFSNPLPTQLATLDTTLPGFGPFGTSGMECFDEGSPAYVRIAHLCDVRSKYATLRIGRQYAREIRVLGPAFILPPAGELVAWSRILDSQEAVCIVNPHGVDSRGGDVVVAAELWDASTDFTVVANTAQVAAGASFAGSHPVGSKLRVQRPSSSSPAFLQLRNVGPAEVIVLVKEF